jgi:hypothetical protein
MASGKKKSSELRKVFLQERAQLMASKRNTTAEKALRAIMRSEEARIIYRNLNDLLGKKNSSLTQVDVKVSPDIAPSPIETVTHEEDMEADIMWRNRNHSLEVLATPFFADDTLRSANNPEGISHQFGHFLDGSFLDSEYPSLFHNEQAWIRSLQKILHSEISLALSVEDFKSSLKPNKSELHPLHLGGIWAIIVPY